MRKKVESYVYKDSINKVDFMVALLQGAKVLAFDEDGLFIKTKDNIYMITCRNIEKGYCWIEKVIEAKMFVTHQKEYVEKIKQRFQLKKQMVVHQWVYTKPSISVLSVPNIDIKKIDQQYFKEVKDSYSTSSEDAYLIKQLQ